MAHMLSRRGPGRLLPSGNALLSLLLRNCLGRVQGLGFRGLGFRGLGV